MQIHSATKRKFFIIIDEWDALFREAKQDTTIQREYIQLLRSLFKNNVTPQIIAGAYMTGILPIKKYGTQSALTDFLRIYNVRARTTCCRLLALHRWKLRDFRKNTA